MQGPGTGSSRRVGPSSLSTWGQSGLGLAGGGRPLVPTAQRHPPARASFLCAQSPDLQNKAGVFCKPSVWGRGGGGRETKGAQSGINCVSTGWAGGERGAGLACVRDWDGEAGPHRPGAPSGPRELTPASGTLCRASPLSLSRSAALKSALKSSATL